MKLWQMEAQRLPVLVRPLGGETIPSFARRLSEANDLPSTTILRAIGTYYSTGKHLFARDAWLNDEAINRLQTYSGIPRRHLEQALPGLRWGHPYADTITAMPSGIPALRCYPLRPAPRYACSGCASRAAVAAQTAPALVRSTAGPLICRTHRRWLGGIYEIAQLDISNAREIVTAHRRYRRLLTHHDRTLVTTEFRAAHRVTTGWAGPDTRLLATWRTKLMLDRLPYPGLRTRWQERAENLGLPNSHEHPGAHPAVTFPEAVALTEILTDLNWRRHVALVPDYLLDRFHNRVAQRLNQKPARFRWNPDPLKTWVHDHRYKYSAMRQQLYADDKFNGYPRPFPEIRHFK
jgi:hypothetical protein